MDRWRSGGGSRGKCGQHCQSLSPSFMARKVNQKWARLWLCERVCEANGCVFGPFGREFRNFELGNRHVRGSAAPTFSNCLSGSQPASVSRQDQNTATFRHPHWPFIQIDTPLTHFFAMVPFYFNSLSSIIVSTSLHSRLQPFFISLTCAILHATATTAVPIRPTLSIRPSLPSPGS